MGLYIIITCLIVCLINLLRVIFGIIEFGFDRFSTICLIVQILTVFTSLWCLNNYLK